MRAVAALALVVVLMAACGGGASPSEIRVAPGVTTGPTADPNAPAMPKPTGGYDYGY